MTTTQEIFQFTAISEHGEFARFAGPQNVFIRYRGQWEHYRVTQKGASRGLEMFTGYVTNPEQIEVLENATRMEVARRKLASMFAA